MNGAKEFLEKWVNDVKNEQKPNESLDYSEREVTEMLEDYKKQCTNCDGTGYDKRKVCGICEGSGKLR